LLRQIGWMPRYIGQILLNINDHYMPEAQDWIKKAIEADKNNGMMFRLVQDYVLYAESYKRNGGETKAKESLSKAIEIYKDCGADGWVEKAEAEMAELH